MPLSPSDIASLSRRLDEALDLEPPQIQPWLDALPAEQRHLIAPLRDMLAERLATGHGAFLASSPRMVPVDEAVAHGGDLVGPYRLLHEIGRGGMGSVWLAERADGTYKRQVALKLPRLAWGAGLAGRMARERDIGALLEHPAIARLYDAGVDERGRPYLALEYVDGQPIDAWCEAQGLSVRERLRLFVQVARAVAYAHGRLVVHRDLKPSNVLVTPDGQSHLLDFGIAKLLHEAGAAEPGLTQEQGRVMTPHYASPEQVAGEAITVQSDVYSLGVLLYELLTGALPIEPKRGTLGAVEEAILQGDAPLASSRVKDRATAKALRGEVDAILVKAMQLEPARRYATADALAQDIERHLNGETVAARPDSAAYRLRKAVRRHWVGVTAVAAVMVAVLTGSGVAVVQAQRAAQSAERERVVKAFVTDVFRVNANVNAADATVRPASARRLLEDGAQLIERRFSGQLELQAELYGILGDLCLTLGDYGLAASYASRRVETLTHLRPDRQQQAAAVLALAAALYEARKFADAEPRARHALELAPQDLALQAEALVVLGGTHAYAGRLGEARSALDAAQVKLAAIGNKPSVSLAKLRARQGLLLVKENRMDLAIQHYRQGVDVALAAEGAASPAAAHLRLHLTMVLFDAGRPVEAVVEQKQALDALTSLGGVHAARAAFEGARFASWYSQRDRENWFAEAVAAIEGHRDELARAAAPIPEWFIPQVNFWLGTLKSTQGDIAAGLPLMEASFQLLYESLDAPTDRFDQVARFGGALMVAGRHDLADRWLREVVTLRHLIGEGNHPWAAGSLAKVAVNLRMAGRINEAQTTLQSISPEQTIRGTADPNSINRLLLFERVRLLLDQDDGRKALEVLEKSTVPEPLNAAGLANQARLLGEARCAAGQFGRGLAALTQQIQADAQTALIPHEPG